MPADEAITAAVILAQNYGARYGNDAVETEEKTLTLGDSSFRAFYNEIKSGPREVFVTINFRKITELDPLTGRMEAKFFTSTVWYDPALIGIQRGDSRFGRTVEEYSKLWQPLLEIDNALSFEAQLDADSSWNFLDAATGQIAIFQIYNAVLTVNPDVKHFPFDSIEAHIDFSALLYDKKQVKIIGKFDADFADPLAGVRTARNNFPEWELSDQFHYESTVTVNGNDRLLFVFLYTRLSSYYLYKVVALQVALACLSWPIFFLEPTDFNSRFTIVLTLLLSSVAFLFVINDAVPKVPYLTTLDKVVLWNFFLLFLGGSESFIVYLLASPRFHENLPLAERVDLITRWVFPILCLGMTSVIILYTRAATHAHMVERSKKAQEMKITDNLHKFKQTKVIVTSPVPAEEEAKATPMLPLSTTSVMGKEEATVAEGVRERRRDRKDDREKIFPLSGSSAKAAAYGSFDGAESR